MTKTKNLLVLMLVMALGIVTACGGSDEKETEQQVKTRQLSKTWNITNVELVSGTGDYSYQSGASTITFNKEQNYTITGQEALPYARPYAPISAGTWAWNSTTNLNAITLTPSSSAVTPINLSVTTLTDNSLIFEYPGALGKAENQVTVRVTAVPK